jgi:SAM-dependent methyltransferase
MSLKDSILESSLGYGLWSASFIRPKIEAIRALLRNVGKPTGSFLDIGCGPGSNSPHFGHDYDYLGVDINPAYIDTAQRKHPTMKFAVGDATQLNVTGSPFDIVLINSLIHHLDDAGARSLLIAVQPLLKPDGVITVQEPIVPEPGEWLVAALMRLDRGKHFRSLDHWRQLYQDSGYTIAQEAFYPINLLGRQGWKMHSVLLKPTR